jgi:hypothetical protein
VSAAPGSAPTTTICEALCAASAGVADIARHAHSSTIKTFGFAWARSAACSAAVNLKSSGTTTPPRCNTPQAATCQGAWFVRMIAARSSAPP